MKFSKSILAFALVILAISSCKKDPCEDNGCLNNSTCTDVDGEAVCGCLTGYTGTFCGEKVIAPYLGNFNAVDTCDISGVPVPQSEAMRIGEATDILSIEIFNIYGLGDSTIATVNPTTLAFTIAGQPIDYNRGTVTGSGSISGNRVLLDYAIDYGGGSITSCEAVLTKN